MVPSEILCRLGEVVFSQQVDHSLSIGRECSPHCLAPTMNRCVALSSCWSGHHRRGGGLAPILGEYEGRPGTPVLRHSHVRALNLTTREAALDVEVQAGQREGDTDRFALARGVLRPERVDDVLVSEHRIAVRERVRAQLIIRGSVSGLSALGHESGVSCYTSRRLEGLHAKTGFFVEFRDSV